MEVSRWLFLVQARAGWGTAVQFLVGFGVSGCSETAHLAMERVLMSPGGRTNGLLECFFFVNLSEVFCIIHSGISYAVSIMYILYIMYRHLLQIYIYTYILIHICAFTNTHICTTWYAASLIVACRLRSVTRFCPLRWHQRRVCRFHFWGVEKVKRNLRVFQALILNIWTPKKTRVTATFKSARWVSFYHSLECFFCWVSQDSSKILVKIAALDFKGRISGASSGQIHAKTHLSDAETTWSK